MCSRKKQLHLKFGRSFSFQHQLTNPYEVTRQVLKWAITSSQKASIQIKQTIPLNDNCYCYKS